MSSEEQGIANDSATPTTTQSISAVSLETDTSDRGDNSDADSTLGSWRSTRTQSLTSSVAQFKYENGRRYYSCREGEYHLPNDESEQDRLDMQHYIFRLALDQRLFLAPLEKDKINDVLDVGCGTVLWAIDMADELPQAQVLGFDLSPIQPDMVPPNCNFLVDDCNADWLFTERFDLIHTRAMTPGIKDWSRYVSQVYEHLKPGCYVEMHEIHCPGGCTDATSNPTPDFVKWSQKMVEAGSHVGLDFSAPKKMDRLLQEAGFEDIKIQWQNWPVGTWAKGSRNKDIGHLWGEDLVEVTRNTSALFTRVLGWRHEEFDVFAVKCANEICGNEKHMWIEMCFAYGRKPQAK